MAPFATPIAASLATVFTAVAACGGAGGDVLQTGLFGTASSVRNRRIFRRLNIAVWRRSIATVAVAYGEAGLPHDCRA